MKKISKLHIGDLGKCFSAAFFFITLLWCVASYLNFGAIILNLYILIGNFALSGIIAFVAYRLIYRRVLEYDGDKFHLRIGGKSFESKWREFKFVSLYHRGYGILSVRLYHGSPDEKDFIEIPASDLGLEPHAFRSEVSRYAGL